MSESKHTPGPWRTDTDIFHDRLDIRDESGRRIAVCIHDYPMSMARHDANARLIAAAPEMLEALESCCIATQGKQKAFCECFQHDSMPCLDMEGVCWFGESGNCKIWKAIQKARGLQQ
jgi:hypothetical protein